MQKMSQLEVVIYMQLQIHTELGLSAGIFFDLDKIMPTSV